MSSGVQQDAGGDRTSGVLERTQIHDVLRNDRRRLVLERLQNGDTEETVRDLSEYIASVETGESPAPRNIRQSVYVSLHQTHLPKLDSLGIVTYDSDAKKVKLAGNAGEVTVYLEVVPKYGLSWGEYYFGLSLLALAVLVASWVGVPVIAGIAGEAIAAVFFLLIAGSAVFHISTQQSTIIDRLRDR